MGVHIADVSYFVREGTPLDAEAARRATTVRQSARQSVSLHARIIIIMSATTPTHHSTPPPRTTTGVPGAEGGADAPAPPLRAALQVG